MEKRMPNYRYVLPRNEVFSKVDISKGDYDIINIYHQQFHLPRTTIVHEMIGTAGKCWEESHVQAIEKLKNENKILLNAVDRYQKLYGPLPRKRRLQ